MKERVSNLTIRLTVEEKAHLRRQSKDVGLSVSDYIRHLLFSSSNSLSNTAFEKRALWFLTRLYFSEKERSVRDFDREKIDLLNEETEKQLKKWGY